MYDFALLYRQNAAKLEPFADICNSTGIFSVKRIIYSAKVLFEWLLKKVPFCAATQTVLPNPVQSPFQCIG